MKVIKCATLEAFEAVEVDVEVTFIKGLPAFSIVGLITTAISESRDRVKSALLTNEFKFPPKKITVNLSPSNINKQGSHFDLSIALLICLYESKIEFDGFYVFGELGLDGTIKDTNAIFPLILSLSKSIKNLKVVVPKSASSKIAMIPNIEVYGVQNLAQCIELFQFKNLQQFMVQNSEFKYELLSIGKQNYFYNKEYHLDFSDVKGQKVAKTAALIAACGNHNLV